MKRKPNLNNLYTEKQVQALTTYATQSFKIMILSGAVRTGKTVIDNDIFLMELRRVRKLADENGVKEPIYILAGYSSTTITNNILNPLENKYRIKFQFDRNNAFRLYGVKVIMAYTGNDRGASAIRGSTAYGAYINEASLATESVFHEINNRVSVDGGRIIADTNPESPTHWLKKKYIDRANDPATRTVVINFKLDDNRRFLSDEYISQLKASYGSGALYDRAILGLWTAAEGAVFPDFDDNNYIDREELPKMKKYIAGVDWGYKHYGSIVVIGVDYDENFYLVEEHAKQLKQVEYWVDVAHEMQERYGRKLLFVADSAEQVIRALNSVNCWELLKVLKLQRNNNM